MQLHLRITLLLLFGLTGIVIAQSVQTVKVSGRVFDPYGAVIPHVTVTLKDQSSREVTRVNTDETGSFVFDSVAPGMYELTAQTFFFEKLSKSISVEGEKENRFDVALEFPHCPDPVKRLSEEEKTTTKVCEVHHEQLKVGIVPIQYGLIIVTDSDERKLFPNSNMIYYGGCVVDCYKKAEVLYCPVCRELEYQLNKEVMEVRKWPGLSTKPIK